MSPCRRTQGQDGPGGLPHSPPSCLCLKPAVKIVGLSEKPSPVLQSYPPIEPRTILKLEESSGDLKTSGGLGLTYITLDRAFALGLRPPLHSIKEVHSLPCLGVVLRWGRDSGTGTTHSCCLSYSPWGSRLALAPGNNPFTSIWGTNTAEE